LPSRRSSPFRPLELPSTIASGSSVLPSAFQTSPAFSSTAVATPVSQAPSLPKKSPARSSILLPSQFVATQCDWSDPTNNADLVAVDNDMTFPIFAWRIESTFSFWQTDHGPVSFKYSAAVYLIPERKIFTIGPDERLEIARRSKGKLGNIYLLQAPTPPT
jgi:hypothetical protein